MAAHLAVANGKGWNSCALEAILRNTSLYLLRRNLARDANDQPRDGRYIFISGPGYGWKQWVSDGFYTALGLDDPEKTIEYEDDSPASDQGFQCGALLAAKELGLAVTDQDIEGATAAYRSLFNTDLGFTPTSRKLRDTLGQDTLYGATLTYAVFEAWTQFAGWSPDGKQAIIMRGWEDPENARWEEEHKTLRMELAKWMLDSCLLDLASGKLTNLTAIERVSHYNGGLSYLPQGKGLGFTPLINEVSKPYVMDLDGRNKRDVSGKEAGFTYGYSASPDGKLISYHENYQIYFARADGSEKKHNQTGNPFNFGPRWSTDGKSVLYTAQVGKTGGLFQVSLDGKNEQLTKTPDETLHYHPEPSLDGQWLAYGSKRAGVRQLYVMRLADHSERRMTNLAPSHAAMWLHWQPAPSKTP